MSDPAPIRVIVRLRAGDGQLDAAERLLKSILPPSRNNPDCVEFRVFRDVGDPAVFMVYEHWISFAANRAHAARDYMNEFEATKGVVFAAIDPVIVTEIATDSASGGAD